MNLKEVSRLALYAIAAIAATVIAIIAYTRGDLVTVTACLGWLATNIVAGANINHTAGTAGDHAAR